MIRIRGGFAFALLLTAAACSDDPTSIAEGDALSEAEAAALAEVVAGTLFGTWEQSSGGLDAPARVTGTFQVNDNLPCEFGGSVAVSGSLAFNINDQTGDGTLDFTVTQDHESCMAESEDGIRFTLSGSPNIEAAFMVVTEGDFLSFDGTYDGAVAWTTEGKSGTCSLDVDFGLTGNLTQETGTATLTGSVCGVTFSHNLTLT